ncbi:hypothetical protein ACOME3_004497 [Neoechinorhynchus agilis]
MSRKILQSFLGYNYTLDDDFVEAVNLWCEDFGSEQILVTWITEIDWRQSLQENRVPLSDETVRIAVSLRLGVPTSYRCRCGATVEPSGRHGLVCRQSGERFLKSIIFDRNASNNRLYVFINTLTECNYDLISMDLSYNSFGNISKAFFEYACSLQFILISDNLLSSLSDTQEGGFFAHLESITHLDLSSNRLYKYPVGTFWKCYKLQRLNLSNNVIDELDNYTFFDLTSINSLDLSFNRIMVISYKLFEYTDRLKILYLNHNKIVHIDSTSFQYLNILEELRLQGNLLANIDTMWFNNLVNLKIINLSDNSISIVPQNAFHNVYMLHEINLSNNLITKISPNAWKTLSNVRVIDLSLNKIKHISAGNFAHLCNLNFLNLSRSNVLKFHSNAFEQSRISEIIDLTFNSKLQIFTSHKDLVFFHNEIYVSEGTLHVEAKGCSANILSLYLGHIRKRPAPKDYFTHFIMDCSK